MLKRNMFAAALLTSTTLGLIGPALAAEVTADRLIKPTKSRRTG